MNHSTRAHAATWFILAVTAAVLSPLTATTQPAPDDTPAAVWTFNGRLIGLARDTGPGSLHASLRAETGFMASPGAYAIGLDGRTSYVSVQNHPDLVMTDTVSLDVWVKLDTIDSPEPQCLIDKGGERYRLQVSQGGGVMLGLKNDEGRFDLYGGRVEAGRWHRITGVFERPNASLFIDGALVAQGKWDQPIGPGNDLFIGSKGGVTYFTQGQIDEVRIYREARPPKPDDKPTADIPGAPAGEAKMDVEHGADGVVTVDTGAASFKLTEDGVVSEIAIGGEPVVSANTAPLLAATLLESADCNGWRDHVTGREIEGAYQPAGHEFTQTEGSLKAAFQGRLDFGGGDAIDTETMITLAAGSRFMSLSVRLTPRGQFENRFLRSASVRLPLALNKRKRIVQGGDRGVRWNTRHWYQFLVDTVSRLLDEPDHNIWRNFVIDQNSDHDYHIWRSESDCTSPLSMQRGIAAPGWIAAYDERAGLLVGYRDFAMRAPKTLWLNADGSGEAMVHLWSPTQPALSVGSPQASAVFGEAHEIDLLPYTDDFRFAQPDLSLAQLWGEKTLSSTPPPRNEIPAQEVELWTSPAADDRAPMVCGGVPFPKGALTDSSNVRLRDGENDVPVQTRAVAYWPDKSIKWLLLTFPADGGEVTGARAGDEALSFELTRRSGPAKNYRLEYGGQARTGVPQVSLQARESAAGVQIDTGPLEIAIGSGSEWLRGAKLNGTQMLSASAGSYVDFLRPDAPPKCGRTHAQGAEDDGRFVAEKVELEEAGPLRAVVRLEGMTTSREPQRMIVRLEAYAGRSCIRVFQTVEFLHKDPRTAFVRRMGIDLPLADTDWKRVAAGGQDGPVLMEPGRRVGLRQYSHLGYTAWRQADNESFQRVVDGKHRSRGWLDVTGSGAGVTVAIREMWQQFPNELSADLEAGILTAGLWPESAPLMDVRRYSNYPHRSQGESSNTESDWVAGNWYPNDCFVGVSKTHEMLLYFHGASVEPGQIDGLIADFQSPPLVYAGRQWYDDTGVVLPEALASSPGLARCEANLDHFARFWMLHQKLWGWYGMWDFGDVGHYFKGGYGSTVSPDDLRKLLAGGEQAESVDISRARFLDYSPNHDWAFDNGRWGWSNTEGLTNMFMQTHYMRTGDRDVYFFMEAMARHFRDVDMRHDGKWLGYGTRHGVQHWSDGNHEERQTTHSEFRYHHYMSGDMRSRDFARQLYERIYTQRNVTNHATHSGRMQGLLAQWEMTGSDEVADILARYMPMFRVPEGLVESPRVKFPEVERYEATGDINQGNMFFWSFGAGHGIIEYFNLTGDEDVRQALIKTADDAIADNRIGLRLKAVVFAAHHADDPEPYREAIREWAQSAGRYYLLQIVPHNPEFYAGPRGLLRGSTAGALFTMNDLPYVLSVLDEDPPVNDEIRRVDENGGNHSQEPNLSWQSEYDLPEFEEHLRIKHPQP